MTDEPIRGEWVDAFYLDTWTDPQALQNPRLTPRMKRTHGPYRSYQDAEAAGVAMTTTTHFGIRKLKVIDNLVTFINHQ